MGIENLRDSTEPRQRQQLLDLADLSALGSPDLSLRE